MNRRYDIKSFNAGCIVLLLYLFKTYRNFVWFCLVKILIQFNYEKLMTRLRRPDLGYEDVHDCIWLLHYDHSVIICEKKSHKEHRVPKIIVQAYYYIFPSLNSYFNFLIGCPLRSEIINTLYISYMTQSDLDLIFLRAICIHGEITRTILWKM